ncbi:polysaccharide deacetylase family protein [Gemmobacter denitrificans]|uniref:Polysaccharide deacetylase family protein n=1 Tax=Gemmobacter denitrificans TaxID=3123040 RepID=A0ABU8BUY5_9RHOB
MTPEGLKARLDDLARQGRQIDLWWRDDDAIAPGPALDRLLALAGQHGVPLTIAAIPAHAGQALADRLAQAQDIAVAVHGWDHANHAPPDEKKQELGAHRPVAQILDDLGRGLARLAAQHGPRFVPVLVPPWNRISPDLVPYLPGLGFRALSVYGPPKPAALPVINTHLDVMAWRGLTKGRPPADMLAELDGLLAQPISGPLGVLSHHLVHDEAAWQSLSALLSVTCGHPACHWRALPDLLP